MLAALMTACAARPPEPVRSETVEQIAGVVEAVDRDTRSVLLRVPTRDAMAVEIAPSVRNFAHVQVGDRIVVRFYTVLAAELRRRGDASGETEEPTTTGDIAIAPEGARPGGIVGTQVHQTVRVIDVNKRNHVVTFYGSDGISRALPVRTAQGREFIRKLKSGDEVDVTYTRAIALSVEPGT
jgi:hypothetical protein